MDAKRILVTGVGANPGFDLARSLLRLGHQVIATDASPLAPGLLIPTVSAQVTPRADDPAYPAFITALCRDEAVDAIVAGIENDIPPLLRIRDELDRARVRLWLPDEDSVLMCIDKAAFARVLTAHGIATAPTFLPHQLDQVPDRVELVVKPRRGHGAQNVHFCRTREQARVLAELMPEPVIQPRLHGAEFTADCLVDRMGRASVILRHRDMVQAGLAAVSSTFHDPDVAELVGHTLNTVRAAGLCCVQGFVHDGQVTITELNVRIAGGFALTEAAGADLVGQWVAGLFDQPVDHDRLTYQSGMFLTKYVETLACGDVSTLPATAYGRGTTT